MGGTIMDFRVGESERTERDLGLIPFDDEALQ